MKDEIENKLQQKVLHCTNWFSSNFKGWSVIRTSLDKNEVQARKRAPNELHDVDRNPTTDPLGPRKDQRPKILQKITIMGILIHIQKKLMMI